MFVELHAQSAFSFLEGAELPEAYVAEAARLGMPALAPVDRGGGYGGARVPRAPPAAGGRGADPAAPRPAGGPTARRRLHVHPREDRPRPRRPAPHAERRAAPPGRGGDGAALRRPARRARGVGRAGASPLLHARGPRLPLPRLPAAAGAAAPPPPP